MSRPRVQGLLGLQNLPVNGGRRDVQGVGGLAQTALACHLHKIGIEAGERQQFKVFLFLQ